MHEYGVEEATAMRREAARLPARDGTGTGTRAWRRALGSGLIRLGVRLST